MSLVWRRRVGGVLWGVGLLVALAWGGSRRGTVQGRGLGWAPPVHLAALEIGQLSSLDVELHDDVQAGQVVARLDPELLLREREVLSAELLASQEDQVNAVRLEARRFAQGLEGWMLDRASVATRLREDEALWSAMDEQLAIERDLLRSGATSTQNVLNLEREMRVVEARVTAGRDALGVASRATDAASARSAAAPGANQWQVVAVSRQLEAIDARIQRLALTSGIDGQVTAVYHAPGEVVRPGDPVVQIRRVSTDEVVAWLPASASVQPGRDARVVRANGEVLYGSLVSVGRGLQPLPAPLLDDPQRAEFGVPVRVRLQGGTLAPDEPVVLRL